MESAKQPRIVHKLLIRTVILLFTLALVFVGIRFALDLRANKVDLGHADTVGMIAAIQDKSDGSQVVLFKPDGTLVPSPDYKDGKTDREASWRPDGERIFFSSDREKANFQIFRWNPGSGEVVAKTSGEGSQSTPFFATADVPEANDLAIITSRGFVLDFNTTDGTTHQLLPPKTKEVGRSDEGGSTSQFDVLYEKYGNSFQTARWVKGRKWIAAVMEGDKGQTLIVQNMEAATPQEGMPHSVVSGEHVEIDVDPKNGRLVYAVRNYRLPDSALSADEVVIDPKASAKREKPFLNAIGMIDPDNPGSNAIVVASKDNKLAFAEPAVDPSGGQVLFSVGSVDSSGSFIPTGLVSCPLQDGGGQAGTPLIQGQVYEPSWNPSSDKIAYIKRVGGKRAVFTCGRDGSGDTNLSGDKGDFSFPRFSPQVKG